MEKKHLRFLVLFLFGTTVFGAVMSFLATIYFGNLLNAEKQRNELLRVELQYMISLRNTSSEVAPEVVPTVVNVTHGINKNDLRNVIRPVLRYLGEKNVDGFTELLMVTAAAESNLGVIRKQKKGPAVSVFQIEPTTEKCTWDNYLKYNQKLGKKVTALLGTSVPGLSQLHTNMEYAITMAYLKYKRGNANPNSKDINGLAELHKKIYNTRMGKASVKHTMTLAQGLL